MPRFARVRNAAVSRKVCARNPTEPIKPWLFVVEQLVLTMKGLKEILTLPRTIRLEALHFFTVPAHGIAHLFMSFRVRSVQSHQSVYRRSEASIPLRQWTD